MIKNLKNNPILAHNMRYTRWPSLPVVVLITIILMVGGLFFTIKGYRAAPETASGISSLIALIEMPMPCLGPILMMIVVIRGTVRAINSEKYRLMRRRVLSARAIVNGFIISAVYRLRLLWMVAVGLFPPVIVAQIHNNVAWEIYRLHSHCTALQMILADEDRECPPPPVTFKLVEEQTARAWFTVGIFALLFLLGIWLTTNFGIWNAFRHRDERRASDWTITQMLLLGLVSYGLLAVPMWLSEYLPLLLVISVPVGLNIGLGWWAYRQAVKCVRGTME